MWEKLNKYFMRHLPWFAKEKDRWKIARNWRFCVENFSVKMSTDIQSKEEFYYVNNKAKARQRKISHENLMKIDCQSACYFWNESVLTCTKTDSHVGGKTFLLNHLNKISRTFAVINLNKRIIQLNTGGSIFITNSQPILIICQQEYNWIGKNILPR